MTECADFIAACTGPRRATALRPGSADGARESKNENPKQTAND